MALSLQDIRTEFLEATGQDLDDYAGVYTRIDSYINRSFWEIMDKLPFRVKEKTVTFLTTSNVNLYAVPTDFESIRTISIEVANTLEHLPLKLITIQEYESNYVNKTANNGSPLGYLREGNNIRLYPTPDKIYTITIKYNAVLADLANAVEYPVLPQVWHEIILFGAVWRRFVTLNDYARVQTNKQIQMNLITSIMPVEAKELRNTKLAALQVYREENY